MIICYVIWGDRPGLHVESVFSMLTFLPDRNVEEICVVTDHPEFYALVRERIRVLAVSPEEMAAWAGGVDDGLYCRRKIMGLLHALQSYPGKDILYLDSDTFRGESMVAVADALRAGGVCMGDSSGYISKARDRNNRTLYANIGGKSFRGYTVTDKSIRLNAGIIGLPGAKAGEIVADVLAMCDEIYGMTGYYGTDEVAFSFALAKYGEVVDVGALIGHYWGHKRAWDEMLQAFFAAEALKGSSLDDMIAAAGAVDFRRLPLYAHKPRRHKQLERIANKYWPLTRMRFYPEQPKQWL